MRIVFVLILVTIGSTQAQQVNLEQEAFNYFFTNVFNGKYPEVRALQFDCKTEVELTEFGLFTDCFEDESPVWEKLFDNAHNKTLPEKSIDVGSVNGIKFKNRKVRSKIKLHVLQATQVEDKFYVMIGLVKHAYYTHAYFFEMNSNGDVLRWCKTGLTH